MAKTQYENLFIKMKNLNNKQIIKINDLKLKKPPGMINFGRSYVIVIAENVLKNKKVYDFHVVDIIEKENVGYFGFLLLNWSSCQFY